MTLMAVRSTADLRNTQAVTLLMGERSTLGTLAMYTMQVRFRQQGLFTISVLIIRQRYPQTMWSLLA